MKRKVEQPTKCIGGTISVKSKYQKKRKSTTSRTMFLPVASVWLSWRDIVHKHLIFDTEDTFIISHHSLLRILSIQIPFKYRFSRLKDRIPVSSSCRQIVRLLRLKVSSSGNTYAHVQWHFLWCHGWPKWRWIDYLNLISSAHNTVSVFFLLTMVSLYAA